MVGGAYQPNCNIEESHGRPVHIAAELLAIALLISSLDSLVKLCTELSLVFVLIPLLLLSDIAAERENSQKGEQPGN